MKQISALSQASFKELLRDPMATGLGMIFPMSFIAMFLVLPDLPQSQGRISALAFGLPAVLIFSVLSLGLSGTAAPMAQLRKDGVLRSLGMTPVTRSTYLWAQIPARVTVWSGILHHLADSGGIGLAGIESANDIDMGDATVHCDGTTAGITHWVTL